MSVATDARFAEPASARFRQVRMNKWRDDAPPERIRGAIAALASLPDQIAEVRHWYQGEATSADDDFDFVVVVDFDDEQAFERYLRHPAHVDVVSNLVQPLLARTVRIRCDLGASRGVAPEPGSAEASDV